MALSDVQIRFPTAPSRARVRALKVCDKHAQANGQDFVEHIIEKFPSRIKEIRTGNAMSSRPSSAGTSKITASGMPTSNVKPRSSTARSSGPVVPISKSG